MNVNNGQLLDYADVQKLPADEQKQYVEVKRDLSVLERYEKRIALYAPCGCGSGKKFKFCCKR